MGHLFRLHARALFWAVNCGAVEEKWPNHGPWEDMPCAPVVFPRHGIRRERAYRRRGEDRASAAPKGANVLAARGALCVQRRARCSEPRRPVVLAGGLSGSGPSGDDSPDWFCFFGGIARCSRSFLPPSGTPYPRPCYDEDSHLPGGLPGRCEFPGHRVHRCLGSSGGLVHPKQRKLLGESLDGNISVISPVFQCSQHRH